MNNLEHNIKQGFTLIEMLVYTAIFSVMIFALVAYMSTLSQSQIRNQAVLEVNDQGVQALRVITQNLRNATVINSPTLGTSANSLSVNTTSAGTTPTLFTLSGGILYLTQGTNAAVALTNNKVTVSNLSFSNVSRPSTFGTVKVSFTLTSITNSSKAEYNYSNTFYGSGTLR